MIRFTDLLKENPDTIYYKKKTYNYTSDSNRCAFLVYKDLKSNKDTTFGYSANEQKFYCDDGEVLNEIEELKKKVIPDDPDNRTSEYWAKRAIERYRVKSNGGGHLELENILEGLNRFTGEPKLKGRIFLVDESSDAIKPNLDIVIESSVPSGKSIIVTFWTYDVDKLIRFKNQYEPVIEFNGYNPKEVLYEPGDKIYTYNELYSNTVPKKEPEPVPSSQSTDRDDASKYFKVGDRIKVKGMKTGGEVLSIDGNNVTIKITDTDVQGVNVGDERTLSKNILEPDTKSISNSLEKVIDDKTQEFVEKRGKLHTTGAAFTPAEKANLEREVDGLEIEIKILNDLLTSGEKYYTDNVKTVVTTSVQRKLHAKEKEKQDSYSLIAQAEKQYGMPIAKIRQKFRGVPLDKLVKKESIYKRLIKGLLG